MTLDRRSLVGFALAAVVPVIAQGKDKHKEREKEKEREKKDECKKHKDDHKEEEAHYEVGHAYAAWDHTFQRVGSGHAGIHELGDHYLPHAHLLPDEAHPLAGPAGVIAYFGAFLPGSGLRHVLELLTAKKCGDLLYGTAKWTIYNAAGGVVASGYAAHVFKRLEDHKLKLVVHIFNKV